MVLLWSAMLWLTVSCSRKRQRFSSPTPTDEIINNSMIAQSSVDIKTKTSRAIVNGLISEIKAADGRSNDRVDHLLDNLLAMTDDCSSHSTSSSANCDAIDDFFIGATSNQMSLKDKAQEQIERPKEDTVVEEKNPEQKDDKEASHVIGFLNEMLPLFPLHVDPLQDLSILDYHDDEKEEKKKNAAFDMLWSMVLDQKKVNAKKVGYKFLELKFVDRLYLLLRCIKERNDVFYEEVISDSLKIKDFLKGVLHVNAMMQLLNGDDWKWLFGQELDGEHAGETGEFLFEEALENDLLPLDILREILVISHPDASPPTRDVMSQCDFRHQATYYESLLFNKQYSIAAKMLKIYPRDHAYTIITEFCEVDSFSVLKSMLPYMTIEDMQAFLQFTLAPAENNFHQQHRHLFKILINQLKRDDFQFPEIDQDLANLKTENAKIISRKRELAGK